MRTKLAESRKNATSQAEQIVDLSRGKSMLREARNSYQLRYEDVKKGMDRLGGKMKNPHRCTCYGCVAMRASETVYASRMLRSIDRDIAEEKDGEDKGSNPG